MRAINEDDVIKMLSDGWRSGKYPSASTVKSLPTIEPERKRGKWIPVTNGRGGHECDQCHSYAPAWQTGKERLTDYCSTCGAKMEGGAE